MTDKKTFDPTEYYANIPQELKDIPQWVVWGVFQNKQKCPVNPETMEAAAAGQPETWSNYNSADLCVLTGDARGVGFEFNNNGIVGIDMDGVRNPETGVVEQWALDIIELTEHSYTEISPSGTGLHILVKSPLRVSKNKKPVEMYSHSRYFTVTGNIYSGCNSIKSCSEGVQAVYDRYYKTAKDESVKSVSDITQYEPLFDNDTIISKALSAKNAFLFNDLFNGEWQKHSAYKSQNEADSALCYLLAFWTGRNNKQMDELFRMSALMRDKWDEVHYSSGETYGAHTIQEAVEKCDAVHFMYESVKPTDYTDSGNAEVFCRRYKNKAIFVRAMGWLVWDGQKWECNDHKAVDLAMQLARAMLDEATEELIKARKAITLAESIEDSDRRNEAKAIEKAAVQYRAHALKTREAPKLKSMLELSKPGLLVSLRELDNNAFEINTPAGIVDLKNGEISPHDPERLCANITAVAPDSVNEKLWLDHLELVTCGDKELENYLQQVAGMSLIGEVFDENIINVHGDGGNGKSSFFNPMADVMGDYAGRIAPEILTTDRQNKGASLAELKGKRLVIAAELEEGKRLSSSMLKQLASTDDISAERKYKDPESFRPSHTLVLYTNHLPRVGSLDTGTWRRLAVVPFKAKIQPKNKIKNFGAYVVKNAGGAILSWMIQGAVKYCANDFNLTIPKAVKDATEKYRQENDWMSNFLDECCELDSTNIKKVSANLLYLTFREWANQTGEYVRHSKDFNDELVRRGFIKRKTNKGAFWNGIVGKSSDTEQYIPQ